jgi:hypothetical protein
VRPPKVGWSAADVHVSSGQLRDPSSIRKPGTRSSSRTFKVISEKDPESLGRKVARWFAAGVILLYGFAKLNGSQFTVLDSELDKPMGTVSGFWLTWYYFGYSTVYGSIVALAQIVGGVLLTFRRTSLAGALLLLPILINIILVDVFYRIDLGATVVAIVLAILCWVIIAPHGERLLDAVLLPGVRPDRSGAIARWAGRAALVIGTFAFTYRIAHYNNRAPTPIDGVWSAVHAKEAPPRVDRVFFEYERAHAVVFRWTDGRYVPHHFEVEGDTVRIWSEWLAKGGLLYEGVRLPGGTIQLDAALAPHTSDLTLTPIELRVPPRAEPRER